MLVVSCLIKCSGAVWLTRIRGAKLVKLLDVTPKALVKTLPRTFPVIELATCKLMSKPNTVASTPCEVFWTEF